MTALPELAEDRESLKPVTITSTQLDIVAARMRARGNHPRTAYAAWEKLSEQDRNFWREDVRKCLLSAKIFVVLAE